MLGEMTQIKSMKTTIQVIIPVYNALSQTRACIDSIRAADSEHAHIIVVDDCSSSPTKDYLDQLLGSRCIELLRNEQNLGFLPSANRALSHVLSREDCADFVVLLNSDTKVHKGWLDCFAKCLASDSKITLATPVSNNAENLSVSIPEGMSAAAFAQLLLSEISPVYPDITTAIGFCLAIRISALKDLGGFDTLFSRGYGEDSDYHFKALASGGRSVLVDNCFVYHESGASFGESKSCEMAKNSPVFFRRWGAIYEKELNRHQELDPVGMLERKLAVGVAKERHHEVLFLLSSADLCGGVSVVFDVVSGLISEGVDANVIILGPPSSIKYPLSFCPYFCADEDWRRGDIPKAGIYVTTYYKTCAYGFKAAQLYPEAKLVYLIQGYEGWFPEAELEDVLLTYGAIPYRIAVSHWLKDMLSRWNFNCEVIPNGVDSSFFVPQRTWYGSQDGDSRSTPLRLILLTRKDAQGSWSFTTELLRRAMSNPNIETHAVGRSSLDPVIQEICPHVHGELDRVGMSRLLAHSDVFVDSSIVQGFGLLGLEAMSAGNAVVLTETGGIREYAHAKNSILCPVGNVDSIVSALDRLVFDRSLRWQLGREGRKTAEEFDWKKIIPVYLNYFKQIQSEGKPVGAQESRSICSYLFRRMLDRQDVEKEIAQAAFYLFREVRESKNPRSAREILSGENKKHTYDILSRHSEGIHFIRMYEESRSRILQAQFRARAIMSEIAKDSQVREFSLLEKVIDESKDLLGE